MKVIYHKPINLSPPPDDTQLKGYLREEVERLRQIVASALPQEAVPLNEQQVV
jgi:hypothetical protein